MEKTAQMTQMVKQFTRRKVLDLSEIVDELELEVPENFTEIVKSSMRQGDIMRVTKKDLVELKKILNFWKKAVFIDNEAYTRFAIANLISLMRIHCVAVSTNSELSSYVGKFGGINRDSYVFKESYVVTTVMSLKGKATFVSCPSKYHFDE